jgi:fatty acid desaturase
MMRLCWLMCLETTLAGAKFVTGTEWGVYVYLLWLLPLFTSFPYYMLLRDLYQHANADDGKLTNSRVIFCNPLLRWAMFIYGQDAHLTHHLYPAVPHYNLMRLHRLLQDHNQEYREHVVECDGMFFNHSGKPTMLDVIERPTCEPAAQSADDEAHGSFAGTAHK